MKTQACKLLPLRKSCSQAQNTWLPSTPEQSLWEKGKLWLGLRHPPQELATIPF